MGRTLSLLLALVCLSAPELAQQIAGEALRTERGSIPGSRVASERTRVAFRSLPDCLKIARRSTGAVYHARMGQLALAEGAAATGSPLVDLAFLPGSPRIKTPQAIQTVPHFERPPPAA